MRIEHWMIRSPVSIAPDATLAEARKLMDAGGFRRLPVVENAKLVGMVTDRDLRQHHGYLDKTRVSAAMSHEPIFISPRVTAEDAARLMLQHKIGGLPVIEGGRLIGIVTTSDVMRAFLDIVQASQELMTE